MHAQLFADAMAALGLDARYGAYVEHLPAATLATVNLMSLCGLHRRLRGAIVGHLALFEMTSSIPNRRYATGLRRLGVDDPAATAFFDEHVEADAVHEAVAAVDLAGGLARLEPALARRHPLGRPRAGRGRGALGAAAAGRLGEGTVSLRRPLGAPPLSRRRPRRRRDRRGPRAGSGPGCAERHDELEREQLQRERLISAARAGRAAADRAERHGRHVSSAAARRRRDRGASRATVTPVEAQQHDPGRRSAAGRWPCRTFSTRAGSTGTCVPSSIFSASSRA